MKKLRNSSSGRKANKRSKAVLYTMKSLITVITLIVLTSSSIVYGEDDLFLPAWFWDTPVLNNAILTVGYSDAFIESDHAFEEAFNNATFRLFSDLRCIISGERATASAPDGTMQMGSTICQEIDTTGFAAFQKVIVRLDSMRTPSQLIVLVALSEVQIDRTRIQSPGKISEISAHNQAVSGSAPIYLHESSSWNEAEYNARIELAISLSSEIKAVDQKQNDRIVKTIVTKTNVILSKVQTIHRRIDRENGIVQVWVNGNSMSEGMGQ